mmetsp:Transcript_8840/g.11998  ORF Transcript_8840/g.11998 Transcript_8840/m.11998 type:complete len:920 (-) Transcript_8840:188-2947(-)
MFYMRLPPSLGFTGERLDMTQNQFPTPCPDPFYCDLLKPGCTKDDYNWVFGTGGDPIFIPSPAITPGCDIDESWNPSRCGEWRNAESCQGSWRCGVYTSYFNQATIEEKLSTDANTHGSCVSWASMYGMFLGDGTARTITLTSTSIDYSCMDASLCAADSNLMGCEGCNSITGNFIRAQEEFTKEYQTNTEVPWLLVFTGGNRIYECQYFGSDPDNTGLSPEGNCDLSDLDHLLNNNAEGRYRLEMEIWLIGDYNESPVVTQEAVLPIIRSLSYDHRTPFQIPAYDNDLDHLVFRFGTRNEMGGITRSKLCQYPYSSNPDSPGEKDNGYSQYADNECSGNSRTFVNNGICPSDRTPFTIWGTEQFSFTSDVPGLVEWRTFYPDEIDEQILVTEDKLKMPLPVGLYNMVVMVHDVSLVENEDGSVIENMEIMDVYSNLAGHNVFDLRYNQTFTYKIKVPLDYMLYLYDGPIYFCNKGCKDNKEVEIEDSLNGLANSVNDSSYPGVETYADRDGVYGYRFPVSSSQQAYTYPLTSNFSSPWTGMDKMLGRYAQECTICGYGSGTADPIKCSPFGEDGLCGTLNTDTNTLIPTSFACVENQPPYFTRHAYDPLMPEYGNNGMEVGSDPYEWEADNKVNPWLDEEYICRSTSNTREACYCLRDSTDNSTGLCAKKDDFFRNGIPMTNGGVFRSNPGPYYSVENNPGVEAWYEAVEHISRIVPSAIDASDITQGVNRFPFSVNVDASGAYELPNITVYKGESFEFYVTAKDDDDCTELFLRNTNIPTARFAIVDGVEVEGTSSTISDAELVTDYPEYPQGMMLRRRFYWAAPDLSAVDPVFDTRQERSYVCFYADDKYLFTNQPLYCIELIIIFRPVVIEDLNDCFCRTCAENGKYVGTSLTRPVSNFAPRTSEYLSIPKSQEI